LPNYTDSVTPGWRCGQTYLRNHFILHAAVNAALRLAPRHGRLRVLEIGSGVLEPNLLAAILAKVPDLDWELVVLDADAKVVEMLDDAIRTARPLALQRVAEAFSAADSRLCKQLTDARSVRDGVLELASLGLLGALGLDANPERALAQLLDEGMPTRSLTPARISVQHGEFPAVLPTGGFDLVIANFSIQYEIYEGRGEQVCAALTHCLHDDGLLAHAASYWAQIEFLRHIAGGDRWPFVFGLREIDEARYLADQRSTQRLRIRTDALACKPAQREALTNIARAIFPDIDATPRPDMLSCASPNDGLDGGLIVSRAWPTLHAHPCERLAAEDALLAAQPLSSRIEWREPYG
jgi:hypothetical protein